MIDTADDPGRLFVYGTLMSAACGAMGFAQRASLHRNTRSLGTATVAGRLYRLGDYPGLVLNRDEPGAPSVTGELLELSDPAAVFPWLDVYEGITAAAPDGAMADEYVRRVVPVRLGTQVLHAWAYVFVRDPSGLPLIPGGDWLRVVG